MKKEDVLIGNLKENILQETKIVNEMNSLVNEIRNAKSENEKSMIFSQLVSLRKTLQSKCQESINTIEKINLFGALNSKKPSIIDSKKSKAKTPFSGYSDDSEPKKYLPLNKNPLPTSNPYYPTPSIQMQTTENIPSEKVQHKREKPDILELLTLKRLRKKTKEKKTKEKIKEKKASGYVKLSSKFFYDFSKSVMDKDMFRPLARDLIKSNTEMVPASYISVIFFTTLLSIIGAFFLTLFLLFFSISSSMPFVQTASEPFLERLVKVFWILIFLPIGTFSFAYLLPSLERKALETKISRELSFATIHMAAISNSMVEPSKIFNIIVSTKEYPYLEKEFIKLQNEINVYGYDMVTALRHRSFNGPSRKLSDLFNGLATTITSGGDLPNFFDKRAQSLLFEHRLDMEKQAKAAETFMDIYISVVIAAPMILMLILMMMSVSGFGLALSALSITLIMISSVSLINILFLTFLHLKQS